MDAVDGTRRDILMSIGEFAMGSTKLTFDKLRISIYFVAITACFSVYSLIQERLMTVGFGPEDEIFTFSTFIVLINRLVTCGTSAGVLYYLGLSLEPAAPVTLFAVPSVANVISSSAQYEALKYVSFPLQALAKCAKSVPVMVWSWITNARQYYWRDYLAALVVTFGCAMFVLSGDITAPTVDSDVSTSLLVFTTTGILLLSVFVIFDGLTCTVQDKIFGSYEMHSCSQLLYISSWSAMFAFAFLAVSGQLKGAVQFVSRHPTSLLLMIMQSLVSTTVQLFISFTIKEYGALNFALMMTLRQFLSIVLSCIVFEHELTLLQWLGTVFVISGLLTRTLDSQNKKGTKNGEVTMAIKKEAPKYDQ